MTFCPHCAGRLDITSTSVATRCPQCRLIVAAGRAVDAQRASQLSAGTAAGIRLNTAKRSHVQPVDPERAVCCLVKAAEHLQISLTRLRVVDYERVAEQDPDGFVDFAEVLATFGRWKDARQAACQHAGRSRPPTA